MTGSGRGHGPIPKPDLDLLSRKAARWGDDRVGALSGFRRVRGALGLPRQPGAVAQRLADGAGVVLDVDVGTDGVVGLSGVAG